MKKTNTNKKSFKKLIPAAGMLMLSAAMLGTSTFAWFTMNKEVSVVGMEMKAHAEEGLLINEVSTANDSNWDEQANAGDQEFIALRPASTSDLAQWWHANSLNMDKEAGLSASGTIEANYTAKIGNTDNYYTDLDASVTADDRAATAGSVAERHIYFKDASFGSGSGTLDQGEGFYVNYKYYLKSSSNDGMAVDKSKFMITATATQKNNTQSGTNLDKAIRVGVKITQNNETSFLIFAPQGGDTQYNVTADEAQVNAVNTETQLAATGTINIPAVDQSGMLVDVYVWFEGEDQNCKSINLTETLNDYQIDLKFRIAELEG